MEAQNNPRKSKKCSSCKKKKEPVTSLPPIQEIVIFPVETEVIERAYANLTSYGGVREEHKEEIQYVYTILFGEELDFNCNSCVSIQVRKFTNFMTQNKLRI
jgi:hypothetical protein